MERVPIGSVLRAVPLANGAAALKMPATRGFESPEDVASFRAALLDWYDREGRDLPWRSTGDPYAILVSEIMAQQTRVETVVPYYHRWLERFPTVEALATAPEGDVLKVWEGLGYYSRARNLHRAAKMVREGHGGRLPGTVAELRTLPGVGPYTAGAVASIAFSRPAPAVDGNVRRVYARLFDEASPGAPKVEQWAEGVVDPLRPGDFNQALMELGATVCTPRSPSCEVCPVTTWCRARREGTVDVRPAPRRRAPVRREARGVAVFLWSGTAQALVRRRPAEGLLAGLWEFPSCEVGEDDDATAIRDRAWALAEERGLAPAPTREGEAVVLSPVVHQFSHLHVTYHPVVFEVRGRHEPRADERWVALSDLGDLAFGVAQQKIARLVAAGRR